MHLLSGTRGSLMYIKKDKKYLEASSGFLLASPKIHRSQNGIFLAESFWWYKQKILT